MHAAFPAGALVCCGLGTTLEAGERERLAAAELAGHVIFRRNVPDAAALAALSAELRSLAPRALPPILAIDEEGGTVSRLDHLGFEAPAALALGAIGEPDRAREVGAAIGRALAALGLNTVFAPCLDVLTEPLNPVIATRAYGDDPAAVAQLGVAALEGFHAAGIATVVKHFPGHGGTSADSHTHEPVLRRARSEMDACELVPFRAAVAAGAGGVMTAHVRYPDATPERERELPATQSPYWLGEVLRVQLGFTGPVLSDALEMVGAGEAASLEDRIEWSLAAGVDLLLFDDLEHGLAAREHVARLAEEAGWRATLARAVTRVTHLRRRLHRRRRPAAAPAELAQALAAPASRFARIQGEAVALLADPSRALPLRSPTPLFVAVPRGLDADRRLDLAWLEMWLGERFASVELVPFDHGPAAPARLAAEWARYTSAAPGRAEHAAAVLGSLGREDPRWVREAAAALGGGSGPRIGVALHRPAEVLEMPASWTRLITYGFGRNALAALAEVLAGERVATGRAVGLGRR